MQTQIVRVTSETPEPEVIEQAAAILRQGGLVAFPTETVYGLGADARNAAAVARIFAAKGRPAGNPLIVHVADADAARGLVTEWPEAATRLAGRFWPGPLTLVLNKRDLLPDIVTAGGPTVALRVPAHPVALALIKAGGMPLAAPSANRSGNVSPTRAEHVWRGLNGRVEMVLDGGPTPGGIESTVVDVTTTPSRLLRPGPISPPEMEAVIGPLHRSQAEAQDCAVSRSPGMLRRHYAPRAPLEGVAGNGLQRVQELARQGVRVGWLTLENGENPDMPGVMSLRLPREPAAYGAGLYAALHALDDAGVERIVVELPPQGQEWLAVHDRLRRAATL